MTSDPKSVVVLSGGDGSDLVESQDDILNSSVENFVQSMDCREITRHGYRKRLRSFRKFLREHSIMTIDRDVILRYKRHLIEKKYSSNTLNAYLVAIRCWLQFCEENRIHQNVARSVRGTKKDFSFRKDPLTAEQAVALIESIKGSDLKSLRNRAILSTMIRLGPRCCEVTRAKLEDLRQQMGITVIYFQSKGSDYPESHLCLTEQALLPILDYLKARGPTKGSDPLFASLHDSRKRLETRQLRRIVRRALDSIGLRGNRFSAHGLRHTSLNLALLGGASIFDTQQLARHRDSQSISAYVRSIDRLKGVPERAVEDCLEKARSKVR